MTVASLEPSRELYELSGWKQTYFCHYLGSVRMWIPPFSNDPPYDNGDAEAVPAYDLGFLLRKLPDGIKLEHYGDGDDWEVTVFYEYVPSLDENVWANADTPEDAVARLAIELFRQGMLKRDAA